MLLRGVVQIPVEEMKAMNLDPKMGAFRFQVAMKVEATPQGYLMLDFPINETYFYPADSKSWKRDKVVIPVQMLSLALASARGYLAAVSGDFSSFERRTKKLEALEKGFDKMIAEEKNADAKADLQNQRDSIKLQIEAIPIERKQLSALNKEFEHVLAFTGEKENNLNNDFAASKNVILLKIKVSQLIPYLNGVDLGGVRIMHDKKDGNGENYLVIDVNSQMAVKVSSYTGKPSPRPGMKVAPSMIMRLNQSLFESQEMMSAEKSKMPSNLRNLDLELKDDGLHVKGDFHKWFVTVPFETTVDFVTTGPDVFEARVRELEIAGMDFQFLTKFVLEAIKARLDHALKGLCEFSYVGEEKDKSRALQVHIDPKRMIPAFPDLHLVSVDVRDREFLLKIGKAL